MTDTIESLRKVKCQDNNVWVSIKEGGCGIEDVNEYSGGGSRRLESKLSAVANFPEHSLMSIGIE